MASSENVLSQFEISYLTGFDNVANFNLNFTNQALSMFIAVLAVIVFITVGIRKKALVPGRLQSSVELIYELVANMVKDNVGSEGRAYFPFIFTLFMFILFCNLLGMVPGAFTATSHIAVTFSLAMAVFLLVTFLGFCKHGLHFCSLFLPSGTPWWLAPIMVLIELFSFLARPMSLALRLGVNMMAGHIMLKVIAGFVISLGVFLGWLPLAFLIGLTGFEIFIAILQAYVFTILTCVYLNDAIHLH